jgi:hypothetical protein
MGFAAEGDNGSPLPAAPAPRLDTWPESHRQLDRHPAGPRGHPLQETGGIGSVYLVLRIRDCVDHARELLQYSQLGGNSPMETDNQLLIVRFGFLCSN